MLSKKLSYIHMYLHISMHSLIITGKLILLCNYFNKNQFNELLNIHIYTLITKHN